MSEQMILLTYKLTTMTDKEHIEEVIKPFIVDVFGEEYDLDINTDYSLKVKIGHIREGKYEMA